METKNIMIVGVGGQGSLLASKLLGRLLLGRGYDIKVSEVHGMSQRGGSVVTYVRFGDKVYSPIIDKGQADFIVSFELLEAARWTEYLKPGGKIVVNTQEINPMPVITGAAEYPNNLVETMRGAGVDVDAFDALRLAEEAGSSKAVNLALMGRLSTYFDFPLDDWMHALEQSVPEKFLALNKKAFTLGRGALMGAKIAEKQRNTNWKALCIGMILLQSVLYGMLDPMSKTAYRQVPVYTFLMCRYLLATLALLAFRGRRIVQELRTAPVKHYIVPCLCMAAAFIFSNAGLQMTAATNVAFLRSLSALIAPLMLLIFYRKPYGVYGALRQVGVLAGLYLLCAKGGLSSFGLGEVCSLISATLGAGALVFGGQALQYISPATLSCVQAGLAVVMCAGMGGVTGALGATDWTAFTQPVIAGTLVYAALGCTVAGYLLQNMALEHISPKLVGVLQCTYPVMTALTAFVVLNERLSLSGLIGAGVILVCVALESLQKE